MNNKKVQSDKFVDKAGHGVNTIEDAYISKDKVGNENGNWHQPRYLRKRNKSSIVTGIKQSSHLLTVEKKHFYYIGRIDPSMSSDNVVNFIKNDLQIANVSCDLLSDKGEFKSFKVGIPQSAAANILNSDLWPCGAVIRRFYSSQRKVNNITSKTNNVTSGNSNFSTDKEKSAVV